MFPDEYLKYIFRRNCSKHYDSLILFGMDGLEKYTEIDGLLHEECPDRNYVVRLMVRAVINYTEHNASVTIPDQFVLQPI